MMVVDDVVCQNPAEQKHLSFLKTSSGIDSGCNPIVAMV
jgi:hypothetical protein